MGQKMQPVQIDMNNLKECLWYTIVTKHNYEQKFASDLEKGIKNKNVTNIKEIFVPFLEEKHEKKLADGKIKIVTKINKIYPNYVFVKANMDEDVWAFIRKTSGCSTILATGSTPCTMRESEIQKIKMACGKYSAADFEIGEEVEIVDHIFSGNIGIIDDINIINNIVAIKLQNKLTIKVNINNIIRRK